MKNLSLIALLFLVLFSACKKDELIVTPTPNPTEIANPIDDWKPVVENVSGKLVGQVKSETGTPIGNATVTLNNEVTNTNQYGFFFFDNVVMNSKGAYVKVEKSGYFLGSRRFFPQADVRTNVQITLLKKNFDQSFSSNNEAVMEFEGASVKFPANSIAQANGESYTGNVNFAAKWLDPSSPEVFSEMPGNLQGVDTESEEVALQTLGMIAVELEDDAGNELNILAGNTATISVPVPEELRANAPAEIPLWSFDEEHGMWVEEGKASLVNGVYVGEVAHFSFWNCDIPADYTNITMTIKFENGEPFAAAEVALFSESNGTGYGFTDENGLVSGIIPANQSLVLKVYSENCDEPVYVQTIGAFSEDTDIGVIIIESSDIFVTSISGFLTDCMNNPLQNGFLKIEGLSDINYIFVDSDDSEFLLTHVTCYDDYSISIAGVDLENLSEGIPIDVVLGEENNLGNLSACGAETTPDFVSLTLLGETQNYLVNQVRQIENDSILIGAGEEEVYITIRFAGLTSGSYGSPDNIFVLRDYLAEQYFGDYLNSEYQEGFTDFEVVESNGKLMGTMSGDFTHNSTGEIVNIEGEFQITPPE